MVDQKDIATVKTKNLSKVILFLFAICLMVKHRKISMISACARTTWNKIGKGTTFGSIAVYLTKELLSDQSIFI